MERGCPQQETKKDEEEKYPTSLVLSNFPQAPPPV